MIPQTDALLDRLVRERRDMTIDGVKVFESGDKFLPGKIAAMMAYRVLDTKPGDPLLAPQHDAFFAADEYVLLVVAERGVLERAEPQHLVRVGERLERMVQRQRNHPRRERPLQRSSRGTIC